MPPSDRFVSETQFPVRYAETDAMGIVHHASYIVYLEEGRSHYVRACGSDYAKLIEQGYFLTVAEVHTRYLAPARYGQRLAVRCWVENMGSRSLTFGYEVVDAESNVLHATGQTRHICITHDGRVARIPDSWAAALKGNRDTL